MEVVKQLGIHPTERDAAHLTGERAMIDIGRPPEITTGGDITKLHHPGGAPQMVRLLRTIMVGNIVLVKRRRHAIQERHRV